MTYLFKDFRGIQLIEKDDLKLNLLISCTHWVYSPNFESTSGLNTPLDLYEECMKDKDFGDIAQVYSLGKKEDDLPYELNSSTKLKRIL